MKKLLALLLAAIMVMSLFAACNTNADPTDAPTNAPAKADDAPTKAATEAPTEDNSRPYYVRDASEVTGTITVYTTMGETEQTVLKTLWNKYYPDCKIEVQADSVGTLATRIRSDESCDADVVIGGMFAADGSTYHDILQPYTAACNEEQLYKDPAGYYTFYDVQLMCLVVNPDLRDQMGIEINGYEDLLQDELKGKIIVADPSASSSGWRQLQTILATMGDKFDDDKGWDYIEKLLPSCFSTTSSKDVYNLVINGEYVVGLSYESGVMAQIKDGAPVECIYMEEGNTAMAGGAAIVKNAPNLPAAQAMMDMISSAEFQEARASAASGRGSTGTCDMGDLPAESNFKMVELDFDYLTENKSAMIDKWNDLVASIG